jgi:hypothetical protein
MFEKFTSAGHSDFKQRYLGTYGFFREGNKRVLVQIKAIDRNQVSFIDRNKIIYYLNADRDSDIGFEFIPPKTSWYNVGGDCLLVTRVPARQYLRGLCDRNTSIRGCITGGRPVDFSTLVSIFESTISVEKAAADAVDKKTAFAVSPQFAISLQNQKIFCFESEIGTAELDKNKFKIDLNQPDMWATEVRDAFARSNIEMELV